jgi:hypothetical protein
VAISIAPLAYLALIVVQTPGSLVSGFAIGAVIPLLVMTSLFLTLLGLILIVVAYQKRDRIWHLVLATLVSSSIAVLVFFFSIFDFRR